jgi:hypothetical protein
MIFDVMAYLDPGLYASCERTSLRDPFQPWNTYSAVAYAIAAWMILRGQADLPKGAGVLIAGLLVLIGIASALWHATALPSALWVGEALAIGLGGMLAFLVSRFVFYWPLWGCLLALPVLLVLSFMLPADASRWLSPDGLPLIAPALLLAGAGIWSTARHSNAGLFLLMAAMWLAGGFALLCLDLPACTVLHHGTHFLWNFLAVASVLCLARGVAAAETELLYYEPSLEENLRGGFDGGSGGEDVGPSELPEGETAAEDEENSHP